MSDLTASEKASPTPTIENLTNALEHIRVAALLHWVGQAFDPEHMRGICNLATSALNGEPVPALPDPEQVRARAAAWAAMFDEDGDGIQP